jgi:hypothetical protein
MGVAAHLAMAVERLDRRRVDAVAYCAAQATAGRISGCAGDPAHLRSEPRQMMLDTVTIQPLIALIAGILILLVPRLLNYVVAIYLIMIGLIGLWPRLFYHFPH